jgi:hypothetical protein
VADLPVAEATGAANLAQPNLGTGGEDPGLRQGLLEVVLDDKPELGRRAAQGLGLCPAEDLLRLAGPAADLPARLGRVGQLELDHDERRVLDVTVEHGGRAAQPLLRPPTPVGLLREPRVREGQLAGVLRGQPLQPRPGAAAHRGREASCQNPPEDRCRDRHRRGLDDVAQP